MDLPLQDKESFGVFICEGLLNWEGRKEGHEGEQVGDDDANSSMYEPLVLG